jgi:hypothetical protein
MIAPAGARWCAAAVALVLLVGCGGGPSQEERRAGVDQGWRVAVGAVDEAVGRLTEEFPEIAFVPFIDPFLSVPETRWSDCSGSISGNAVSPTAVQWTARRDVRVEPPQETASLADGLAAFLAADGWEGRDDTQTSDDGGYRVRLGRDGFQLSIMGDTTIAADGIATMRILVYSPCLYAPERMIDWTPPTGPAPTPSPPLGRVR